MEEIITLAVLHKIITGLNMRSQGITIKLYFKVTYFATADQNPQPVAQITLIREHKPTTSFSVPCT